MFEAAKLLRIFLPWFLFHDAFVAADILSASSLEACLNRGNNASDVDDQTLTCDQKMVVVLTLEHNQLDTEKLEVEINDVEVDGVKNELESPWEITVTKSKTIWRYPVSYIQHANNQPYELIRQVGLWACQDKVASDMKDQLSCGYVENAGQMVPDSEGFCCSCTFDELFSPENDRGGKDCESFSEFFDKGDSVHCLHFDELWWAVYEMATPSAHYEVNVKISNADYTSNNLKVSHEVPVAASQQPAIQAKLVGDFATATQPYNFENKYLVVPHRPRENPRVTPENPMQNAMVLDRHHFDLTGTKCDKIGVSYTAFKQDQINKCYRPEGSCLQNQIDSFFLEDEERVNKSKSTRYNVRGFCPGSEWSAIVNEDAPTSTYLTCDWNSQRHTTMVRLEMAADNLRFTTNGVAQRLRLATEQGKVTSEDSGRTARLSDEPPARILSMEIPNFEAGTDDGRILMSVQNIGSLSSDYMVAVTECSEGLAQGPSASVSLAANQSRNVSIALDTDLEDPIFLGECSAEIRHSTTGEVFDTKTVTFNVSKTQYNRGAQEGDLVMAGASGFYSRDEAGSCENNCRGMFDYFCFISNGCISDLFVALMFPLFFCGFGVLAWKFGWIAKVLKMVKTKKKNKAKRRDSLDEKKRRSTNISERESEYVDVKDRRDNKKKIKRKNGREKTSKKRSREKKRSDAAKDEHSSGSDDYFTSSGTYECSNSESERSVRLRSKKRKSSVRLVKVVVDRASVYGTSNADHRHERRARGDDFFDRTPKREKHDCHEMSSDRINIHRGSCFYPRSGERSSRFSDGGYQMDFSPKKDQKPVYNVVNNYHYQRELEPSREKTGPRERNGRIDGHDRADRFRSVAKAQPFDGADRVDRDGRIDRFDGTHRVSRLDTAVDRSVRQERVARSDRRNTSGRNERISVVERSGRNERNSGVDIIDRKERFSRVDMVDRSGRNQRISRVDRIETNDRFDRDEKVLKVLSPARMSTANGLKENRSPVSKGKGKGTPRLVIRAASASPAAKRKVAGDFHLPARTPKSAEIAMGFKPPVRRDSGSPQHSRSVPPPVSEWRPRPTISQKQLLPTSPTNNSTPSRANRLRRSTYVDAEFARSPQADGLWAGAEAPHRIR
eukprot:gene1048-1000_t